MKVAAEMALLSLGGKNPEKSIDLFPDKIGEGAYGTVHKGKLRGSSDIVAVKKIPVDCEMDDIVKEINLMRGCKCEFVVRYYGHYISDKEKKLWIVMEHLSGGSVYDVMKTLRLPLSEPAVRSIMVDSLKGLKYLHSQGMIHRDMKSGNILLNEHGVSKLADFGVSGQLTEEMQKRNTVIGTPFWMAPEVIEEVGHDTKCDIWSLGITAIEIVEGKPPYGSFHPMRAIFMIPTRPPPTFQDTTKWSAEFNEWMRRCLVKKPAERASCEELQELDWITKAPAHRREIVELISMAAEKKVAYTEDADDDDDDDEDEEADNNFTMVSGETMQAYDTMISTENYGTMQVCPSDAISDGSSDETGTYKPQFAKLITKEQGKESSTDWAAKLHGPKDALAKYKNMTTAELKAELNSLETRMDEELVMLRRDFDFKRFPVFAALDAMRERVSQ